MFAVCLIAGVAAFGQPPQRGPGIALAHVDVNSADPEAAVSFWKDVIGTSTYSRGSLSGVSTLGILIVFAKSAPSGPSAGSSIDRLGFRVPDLEPFVERLAKTPYKSFQPTPGGDVLVIDAPDGVRIELTADSSMYAPLEFGHIELHSKQPGEMQAWYGKHFGARPDADDPHTSHVMGATLTFAAGDSVLPTAGRAIDHLSFEVRDLEGFCKALAGDGIKLDTAKATSAFLTDPWGTRIELTEAVVH